MAKQAPTIQSLDKRMQEARTPGAVRSVERAAMRQARGMMPSPARDQMMSIANRARSARRGGAASPAGGSSGGS